MPDSRDTANASRLRHDAEQISSRLPPLLVEAERVAHTVAQGVHGRRRVGSGESFWQFRQYRPDDSAAMIDWRQSAKTQSPFVRETEWEAAESVWLWRSTASSMAYRSEFSETTKRTRAELLLLAIASLLVRAGERVALLSDDAPPSANRNAVQRIAEQLVLDQSDVGSPPARHLPAHARIVLISDFFDSIETIKSTLTEQRAQQVHGHLVQVLDPAEVDLPFDGRVRFEANTGIESLTIGRTEQIRGRYKDRINAHRDELAQTAQQLGWTFGSHRTDVSPGLAVLALYGHLSQSTKPSAS